MMNVDIAADPDKDIVCAEEDIRYQVALRMKCQEMCSDNPDCKAILAGKKGAVLKMTDGPIVRDNSDEGRARLFEGGKDGKLRRNEAEESGKFVYIKKEETKEDEGVIEKAEDAGDAGDVEASCVEVEVGGSKGTTKTVTVSGAGKKQCPTEVTKDNWEGDETYGDVFKVEQSGDELKVTRTDFDSGWGMTLIFKCCDDAEPEDKPEEVPEEEADAGDVDPHDQYHHKHHGESQIAGKRLSWGGLGGGTANGGSP